MFMPAEVTIGKATTAGTKNSPLERYSACATAVSSCRQAEVHSALTCLRKTAQNPPPAYCRQTGDVQFSLGRVCVVCSQTLQSQSSNPAVPPGKLVFLLIQAKTRASAFQVMSSLTFCCTSVYSACTQC